MKILAMENRTMSAKAMLYDTDTGKSSVMTKRYEEMHSDTTLHDPEAVFQKMMEVGRICSAGQKIDMIALSGTWHSVGLFQQDFTPVTPIYLWSNTEASKISRKYREDKAFAKRYYEMTGCMLKAQYPYFKLELLRQKGYAVNQYRIAGQGTYNNWRLIGKYAVTRSMASGSGCLNIHKKEYAKDLLEEIGVDSGKLPELVDYNETFPLTEDGAKLLGVTPGTPVLLSNPDGAMNQTGSGGLKSGVMTVSVGTSSALRMSVANAVLPEEPHTWCYLSPKGYLAGAAISGGCSSIEWFREKIAQNAPYEQLECREDVDTPVFLPFLYGERCPGENEERSGGFYGLKPYHDRRSMYQAVQEGVLFNLRQGYEELCRICGEPQGIRLSGGILHSPEWSQMCADIFEREISIEENPQCSLQGGVVLAMDVLGCCPAEAFEAETKGIIVPLAEHTGHYREKYQRYLEIYRSAQ